MVFTFRSCPISATPSDFPLREKVEVRAATLRVGIRESALMMSSVIPSEKYSLSGLALIFANGRTAIEGCSVSRPSLTCFERLDARCDNPIISQTIPTEAHQNDACQD